MAYAGPYTIGGIRYRIGSPPMTVGRRAPPGRQQGTGHLTSEVSLSAARHRANLLARDEKKI
jgi:hypothetical protein